MHKKAKMSDFRLGGANVSQRLFSRSSYDSRAYEMLVICIKFKSGGVNFEMF